MGRKERRRWEDNDRVEELLQKPSLTDSEREELRKYTGFGGLVASGWDKGQFFTPQVIGEFIAEALDLPDGARVIDPQAGIGRLLWPYDGRCDIAAVEMDHRAASALERIMPNAKVICSDVEDAALPESSFDAVVANPPFGLKVTSDVPWSDKLYHRVSETWTVHLALRLLKPGGVGAFIVPDSVLSNERMTVFRKWVMENALLRAVISLPFTTFQPAGTNVKTSILFLQRAEAPVKAYGDAHIFMAIVNDIGWDSRGRPTHKNDLPEVLAQWRAMDGVPLRLPKPEVASPVREPLPERDLPVAAGEYVQSPLFG